LQDKNDKNNAGDSSKDFQKQVHLSPRYIYAM
jgi:hypothetical protein